MSADNNCHAKVRKVTKKKTESLPVFMSNGISIPDNSSTRKLRKDCFVTPEKRKDDVIFKTPKSSSSVLKNSSSKISKTNSKANLGISTLSKARSTPVIAEKKSSTPRSSSKDKAFLVSTPVTHLCSPSLSPKQRRHFPVHNRCSVKRFFSDSSLIETVTLDEVENNSGQESAQVEEETSNFVVAVRVRPFNFRELSDPKVRNVVQMTECEVQLTCDTGTVHSFTYDHCFSSSDKNHPQYATQEVVFNAMVLPLIDQVFQGYNACLLAYGQTGSGKSYSMMGLESNVKGELGPEAGVIPRFCHELFRRISEIDVEKAECLVEISYFEIYNEKIHDLLGVHSNHSTPRTPLKVREHPTYGPYVVDLSSQCVRSYQDVQGWLTVGNSQRVTSATGMNEKSSRSHSIFSIMITQKEKDGGLHSFRSKVNLVDLAGSERVAQTCAVGNKLKEGVSINKSLLSLGKVITFLSEKGKRKGVTSFVPFRESVLTWLLRESLGGNSRTAMLATISPSSTHMDETLATLRYACQARSIVNRIHKNEDANERVIRELRAEVEKITALREELDRMKKLVEHTENKEKEDEIDRLKKQLIASEELLAKSQQSWSDRLKEAETLKTAELQYLKRCGVAIELHWDRSVPCLVNLAADPILTGTLMYLLPPGRVVIGRSNVSDNGKQPDIGLNGPLVNPHHCEIENRQDRLFLKPNQGCLTYINGIAIEEETELNHGDRVVIGGVHYFRVSNPNHHTSTVNEPIDYDFAHQEILRVQEKRLREELEESKAKAVRELEMAKMELEAMMGAQKCDYERQIQEIVSIVEMQKNALMEERKQKINLEVERNVLEAKVKTQEYTNAIKNEERDIALNIEPYKSTFLKDLKAILQNGLADLTPYFRQTSKVNLHEMYLMVQEATQRCKEKGLNFEFRQQQLVEIDGLKPVIKVVNLEQNLCTLWKPEKFQKFLCDLREDDTTGGILKTLNDTAVVWEANENDPNNLSITLNTNYIKRQLNKKVKDTLENSNASEVIPTELSKCLDEMKEKVKDVASFCSKISNERLKRAMRHFELFMSTIQGNGDSNSPTPVKSSLKDKGLESIGKCVRFDN